MQSVRTVNLLVEEDLQLGQLIGGVVAATCALLLLLLLLTAVSPGTDHGGDRSVVTLQGGLEQLQTGD